MAAVPVGVSCNSLRNAARVSPSVIMPLKMLLLDQLKTDGGETVGGAEFLVAERTLRLEVFAGIQVPI